MSGDMFTHFGLKEDPFAYPEPFESADFKKVSTSVQRCARDRGWLLITGTPGSGKTFAMYEALASLENVRPVRLMGGNRRQYYVTNVDNALFLDLADGTETMRSSREARRRQLERVVGQASREKDVLVLADEATNLPATTFTEIKMMRDSLHFGTDPRNPKRPDRRPLFGVVMVGWPCVADRVESSNELRPRIQRLEMQGLARSEVVRFVEHLGLAKICPKETCNAIADFSRYPLVIMDRLRYGMERAWQRGDKAVSTEDVTMDVSELYHLVQRTGTKLKEIAEGAQVSLSTAYQIIHNTYPRNGARSQEKYDRVAELLQGKLAERHQDGAAAAG